ncbi:endonuclease/exonuclease/phosphatase family protein [Fulvimarina sp. MAC3]|uniref:endonuclease/exonuclease/phosphatase family protein n=1 Tax=Fulvimarina sp. MAC3 TaxID=3148887 RepID=UPI0031FCBB0C
MRILFLVFLFMLTAVLAVATLVPLIETNIWWIRYMDFIRLQLSVMLIAVLVLAVIVVLTGGGKKVGAAIAVVCVGLLGYHAYRLYPYSPVIAPMAAEVASCPENATVTLMSSNVKRGNRDIQKFMDVLDMADPDLLFVMETDAWWDDALKPLEARYANAVQQIPDGDTFFGLHFFSRLELIEPETIAYFDAVTPTVQSRIVAPNGSEFSFMGLHPRPPQSFDQPTTMRDGHIAQMAFHAENTAAPLVAAGDFNAVSWERIVRRAMRVGGLLDPRVGRGVIPTYDAHNLVMAWPLDHVLFQDEIGLVSFERLPDVGSDHYPILATLCIGDGTAPRQSAPSIEAGDREELHQAIDAAQAMKS